MRKKIHNIVKTICIGFFLFSSALVAINLHQIVVSNGGKYLVANSKSEIEKRLNKFTLSKVTESKLEQKISSELSVKNRNWVIIQSLQNIALNNKYDISDELSEKIKVLYNKDHSLKKNLISCSQCALNSQNCDSSIALICGITIEMTSIGDIMSISRAGVDYVKGDPIDKIDVALSIIGISANGLALTSGGSLLPLKAGSSFLKIAYLSGNVSKEITRALRLSVSNGIEWSKLPKVRSRDDLASVINVDTFKPVLDTSSSIGSIVSKTNSKQGMYLLKGSRSIDELKQIASVTDVLKDQTPGYFALLGKSRLLKITLKLSDEVYKIIKGIIGMIFSLLGMFYSLIINIFRKYIYNN